MNYNIPTAQNVILNYRLANIGQRILAGLIDLCLIYIYYYLVYELLYLPLQGSEEQIKGNLTLLILLSLPGVLYFPILEYFLKGQTPGKAILKIRVTTEEGKPPNFGESLLRWILRAVDMKLGLFFLFLSAIYTEQNAQNFQAMVYVFMLLPAPIIGILSIVLSKNNQRVGDFAAATVVLYEQKRPSLKATILQAKPQNYEPQFPNALRLRDKDIYIIKKVVEKAEQKMDHREVIPLANKAKEVLNIETDMLPLLFLKCLLKDYNYLAQEKDLEDETK